MTTIIKATDVRPRPSGKTIRHVAFSFSDMADQAAEYIDHVRREAAQIVDEARNQATAIRKQAEEDGRQAALAAAQRVLDERVTKELETLLPALRTAIEGIENAKHAWMNHWHGRAVGVAAAIAQRVIRRELSCHPEITLDFVKEALELAAGSAEITLRLHPKDHENLRGQVERLAAELAQLSPTSIVADPNISAGGCRVETQFGSIDQQIEVQLARIEQELA